jgi:hypothetical protein
MQKGRPQKPRGDKYRLRRMGKSDCYEFELPRSVMDRKDDMDDVREMVKHNEIDIAIDELRWLLSDCHEMMEAHALLGILASEFDDPTPDDVELAIAHLECALDIGRAALNNRRLQAPLLYDRPTNLPFFQAGLAMIQLLRSQGDKQAADQLLQELIRLDPKLPLPLQ